MVASNHNNIRALLFGGKVKSGGEEKKNLTFVDKPLTFICSALCSSPAALEELDPKE